MAIGTYAFTGNIQKVTIQTSGTYDITAYGAQGAAAYSGGSGGAGAEVGGNFTLTAGERLEIVVGGAGHYGFGDGGGGGGGSFVLASTDNGASYHLLLAAGGGGGGCSGYNGANASYLAADAGSGYGGAAGGNPFGGSYFKGGGGGSGYNSNGNGWIVQHGGGGGSNRTRGYAGGTAPTGHSGLYTGAGGFGGGGGGAAGGGGGGGYTGGNGGYFGGGGGGTSIDKGIALVAALASTENAANSGNGLVTISPACYCHGTLIRTVRGEVPVEHLKVGDRVVTISGEAKPIKWIGRRSYSGRFALGQKHILPICFKAGSIADNVPRRDLWISPHHAMYLEGMLIEAKDLVNGVSVVQAEKVDKIEYFHIELDTHDVIVAEGAFSETYIDDDNRAMFHNAHEYWASHPDAPREPARYCAPRRDEGYEVEAARRQIESRAGLRPTIEKFALRGGVDDVSSHCIAGWAQTVEYPEAPVCLDICAGGRLIGQVLANRYRKDLQEAGLGSGCHSFVFKPPAGLAFALDAVEVRRSLDGAILPLSTRCKEAIAQRDLAA